MERQFEDRKREEEVEKAFETYGLPMVILIFKLGLPQYQDDNNNA
jgi:hypothetical protein